MISLSDPVAVAQALIRCPSVTPQEGGALNLLQESLTTLGFVCERLPFEESGAERVDNLYARRGTAGPHLCFAGHTDVVPPGDESAWCAPPFAGDIQNGVLVGRGAVDMKGAVAAFVAAVARTKAPSGTMSFLITGDEEVAAINGTVKVLAHLYKRGEVIDDCLVGEPSSPEHVGDMMKIGRRGTVNVTITLHGKAGHSAYPERARNPLSRLLPVLQKLYEPIDEGSKHFPPTRAEITSIDTGNPTRNVIPAKVVLFVNIRFGDLQNLESLKKWIHECLKSYDGTYDVQFDILGTWFLTEPGSLTKTLSEAVYEVIGRRPAMATTGGTSDARFICNYTRVVEFGLVNATAHQTDEHVPLKDLESLTRIYEAFIRRYFGSS